LAALNVLSSAARLHANLRVLDAGFVPQFLGELASYLQVRQNAPPVVMRMHWPAQNCHSVRCFTSRSTTQLLFVCDVSSSQSSLLWCRVCVLRGISSPEC